MTHPAVIKAQQIARIAVENGWKGKINTEMQGIQEDSVRVTTLVATRNDESIALEWHGKAFFDGVYYFFDRVTKLHSSGLAIKKVEGWPDILEIFRHAPMGSRPALAEKYVKLPFDWRNDSDEEIINSIIDRKVFWYNRLDSKIEADVCMKSKKNRIQPIGHHKLLHFISPLVGFRSMMLDQVLRVG